MRILVRLICTFWFALSLRCVFRRRISFSVATQTPMALSNSSRRGHPFMAIRASPKHFYLRALICFCKAGTATSSRKCLKVFQVSDWRIPDKRLGRLALQAKATGLAAGDLLRSCREYVAIFAEPFRAHIYCNCFFCQSGPKAMFFCQSAELLGTESADLIASGTSAAAYPVGRMLWKAMTVATIAFNNHVWKRVRWNPTGPRWWSSVGLHFGHATLWTPSTMSDACNAKLKDMVGFASEAEAYSRSAVGNLI